jgi:PAS domain S-box-containing protein
MGSNTNIKTNDAVLKKSAGKQVVSDIAGEAPGQSEDKYRTILEDIKEGYWEIDLAGNLIFFNDSICRLLGYSKKKLLGMNYRDFTTAEDTEKIYKAFNKVYRTGKPTTNISFTVSLKNGGKRFAESSVFPKRNNKGEIIGFRGASHDVTERRQTEEALQAERNKLQSLISAMEDGLTIRDTEYNLTYQNKTSKMASGDHVGEKCYRAFEGNEKICDGCPAKEAFRDGKSHISERKTVLPSGEVIFWENTASPIRDVEGRIVACLEISKNITERKQTEEALRQSEERYRTVLEEMEESYYEVDIAGNFTFLNDAMCHQLGYSREELTRMNYRAITPLENIKKVFSTYNQVYRTGEPFTSVSIERIRKDGTRLSAESSIFPLRNDRGEIIGFRGIARDVTERMQMIEALRRSEERYRTVLEQMEEAYYEIDLAGNFTFFNDAMCRQLGYSREELMGMNYRVYTPKEDVQHMYKAFNQIYRTGKPSVGLTAERIRKDGVRIFAEISTFPSRNESGEIIGFRGIIHDITERTQMLEALKQSEERYRTILEDMEDSYFEVDFAGNLTFANDSTCRHLRYSRKELIGLNYKDFTAAEDAEIVYKTFNKVYRTGKPIHGLTWKVVRKGIGEGFAEATIFPLRNERGEIVGFRGVGRDITERKQAEEEKRQMEQKAQLASRLASVGELASGVAHEINNPLTGVIGYAHLLLDRNDIPEDIKHDLKIISEGGQRVAGIVKKLLTFARQQKPEQKFTDINEIISTTLDLRAYELASNNIKVDFQPARDLPMTVVDPGQLQQVFLNLIINAETEMKLTHGKGKLSIKTEHIDNIIRTSFKDNGPGIAKENLERIFNPFFTTREVGQGTGLGLNLCHGIITEHKGRIWAESKLGKGATFFVELPIVTKCKQSVLLESPAKEPEKVTKAKILVIDDELLVRELASRVLSEEGHEVEAVDNAEDALKRIKNKRYSRILLDIKMPGMGGINLYKQLQEIAPSLKKRVVFITGDVMGKNTTDFIAKTKAPYITKPFDAEQLKTEINRILVKG